jgi:hypothetical protein
MIEILSFKGIVVVLRIRMEVLLRIGSGRSDCVKSCFDKHSLDHHILVSYKVSTLANLQTQVAHQ